jgi:hypothetical protein
MEALQIASYTAAISAAVLVFDFIRLPVRPTTADVIYFALLGLALITAGLVFGDSVAPMVFCIVVTALSWFVFWRRVQRGRRGSVGDIEERAATAEEFAQISFIPGPGLLFAGKERDFMAKLRAKIAKNDASANAEEVLKAMRAHREEFEEEIEEEMEKVVHPPRDYNDPDHTRVRARR